MTIVKKDGTLKNSFELGTVDKQKLRENWQQLVVISETLEKSEEPQSLAAIKNLQKVNLSLLKPFIQELKKKYAARTIAQYRNTLTFYLNEYLATQDNTLLSDTGNDVGETYFVGVSESEVRQIARGLKKFYLFLQYNGLITATQLADFKETIEVSADSMGSVIDMSDEYF